MSLLITGSAARANSVPNPVVGSGTASAESASSTVFLDETFGVCAVRVSSRYDSSGSSSKSLLIPAKSTASELLSSEDSSGSSSKSALMSARSPLFSSLSVDDSSGSSSKSLLISAKLTWFSLLSVDDSSESSSKSLLMLAKWLS